MQQLNDLYKVMRFMSIKQGCWHVQLECECQMKSRLDTNISIPPSCLTTCPSCDGSLADTFKRINKSGIFKFLWSILVTQRKQVNPLQLSALLFAHKDSGILVYGLRCSKPKSKYNCDNTIFQLLAVLGIIETRIDFEMVPITQCILGMDDIDGVPKSRFDIEVYWEGIDLFFE